MEWLAIKTVLSGVFTGIGSFLSKSVTFFTTKPGVYLGAGLLAIGIVAGANHAGYRKGVTETKAAQALIDKQHALEDQVAITAAYKVGMARQKALDSDIAKIADDAARARDAAKDRTIANLKRIVAHVTPEIDRTFPMPCGLILQHDAAALGVPTESLSNPSNLADDAACPITASHLAEIITINYGIDHEKDVQIIGLQDLVKSLAAEIEQ